MNIKKFLKDPYIQELLESDNLAEVYRLYHEETDECSVLTSFLVDAGIKPLEYMEGMVPYMYSFIFIKDIEIPSHITYISRGAFSHCGQLESIHIPEGVTYIGDTAFYGCRKLKEIYLPNSLEEIGDEAFISCNLLTDIHYNGTDEDAQRIKIGEDNNCLMQADWHIKN